MEKNKEIKNKVNRKTGHFLCYRCNGEVGVGTVIEGYIYCLKCGDILKGKRNAYGRLRQEVPSGE